MCQGRVLDYKRKFIEAASRYNELSYKTIIHEDERMTALKNAMICTILASAGQQRSRMLATLYKDERSQQLPAFNILEKMYLDRLIKRSELQVILYQRPSNFYRSNNPKYSRTFDMNLSKYVIHFLFKNPGFKLGRTIYFLFFPLSHKKTNLYSLISTIQLNIPKIVLNIKTKQF